MCIHLCVFHFNVHYVFSKAYVIKENTLAYEWVTRKNRGPEGI